MKKKDGKYTEADWKKGKQIKLQCIGGENYIKLKDLIAWLRENREDAEQIETDWLIKVFVKLSNS